MMGELFGPRNRDGRGRRKPVQLCFEAMESRLLLATTFLVTNTDNSGSGSLRQAILDADAAAATEPATIDFQIGSGGLQTISPRSPLPAITAPVIIDGTSQPSFDPNHPTPMIELTGSNIAEEALPNINGLTISAGNSTVKGMVINKFTGSGIRLDTNGGDVVEGNYLGTNTTGTKPLFGLFGNQHDGVESDAPFTTIGGTDPGARNIISGNLGNGVSLGSNAFLSLVEGNIIGLDVNGATLLSNFGDGVQCAGGSSTIGGTTRDARNIISGNFGNGVNLVSGLPGADDSLVEGNIIGLDLSGEGATRLGNFGDGVRCGGSSTTIGGTTPGAGNIISGNFGNGITLDTQASATLVEGNIIGLDVSGARGMHNSGDGVLVEALRVTIGGTTPDARNIISDNSGNGVTLDPQADGALIEGNIIGLDVNGGGQAWAISVTACSSRRVATRSVGRTRAPATSSPATLAVA